MKRLALCFFFLVYPSIAAAEEAVVGNVEMETCQDVTYLQAVDVTIGENCLRTVQHTDAVRTTFETDAVADELLQSWVMPYTLSAPTYAPLERKTLAILDTGFSANSTWLQSYVTNTYNVITNDEDVYDTSTHGTAVATAAVLAMQEAPVDLLIIKIDRNGQLSVANIVKGINYAIEQGADVINMSIGGTSPDDAEQHAVQAALNRGITVVAAAGNNAEQGNRFNYPASYSGVLSIGAMTKDQTRASFSNYNNTLTLMAPGEAVPLLYKQRIQAINGTSFATPFAAATIASVLQYSDASMPLLHRAVIEQADDLGIDGYDVETGYGSINGTSALAWLRGDEQALRMLRRPYVTITFSHDVAEDVDITLYKDELNVNATVAVQGETVIVTPATLIEGERYTLKIDRDVRSADGHALQQPMYVPIMFETVK